MSVSAVPQSSSERSKSSSHNCSVPSPDLVLSFMYRYPSNPCHCGKSALFTAIITFLFSSDRRISSCSLSSFFVPSVKKIIMSASSVALTERSIDICSIRSSEFLIPAVSKILNALSFQTNFSSITSLVVPSISVTIARSFPHNALSNDDFPAFGLPIIAIGTPFFRIFPRLNEFTSEFMLSYAVCKLWRTLCGISGSTPSSGKSTSA